MCRCSYTAFDIQYAGTYARNCRAVDVHATTMYSRRPTAYAGRFNTARGFTTSDVHATGVPSTAPEHVTTLYDRNLSASVRASGFTHTNSQLVTATWACNVNTADVHATTIYAGGTAATAVHTTRGFTAADACATIIWFCSRSFVASIVQMVIIHAHHSTATGVCASTAPPGDFTATDARTNCSRGFSAKIGRTTTISS